MNTTPQASEPEEPPPEYAAPTASEPPSSVAWPETTPAGYATFSPTSGSTVSHVGHQRRAGKTRNPWGVWLLGLVTLGIYQLFWYYKINSEVREYEQTVDVQPGIAVLALFVPIANFVSVVHTGGRIGKVQKAAGLRDRCSGLIGFVLIFALGTWVVYYQSQLNKVWDVHGNPEPGTVL